MSWARPRLLGSLLLALTLVTSTSVSFGAPEDALMPIEKYTTPKGKNLGLAHRATLLEFSEQLYDCMPWLSVYPGGLGFPRDARDSANDDRYLSTWIYVDQREDATFAALPQERRVSAMFSRYGVDMLRRMTELVDIVNDGNVTGLSVVLSWLKPGTSRPGKQPVNETFALFVDKATLAGFLAKRVSPAQFTSRAKFTLFDGLDKVGRVPLEVWEDPFNSTFRVANYEPPKGARCQ
jgi:hypothetical protein